MNREEQIKQKKMEYYKTYYQNNKERIRKYQHEHRQIPEVRERLREHRQIPEIRERLHGSSKKHRRNNKERRQEYQKEHNQIPEIKKQRQVYNREYYKKHKSLIVN